MMGYYLSDIEERLANRPESNGWEVRVFTVSQFI